MYCSRHVDSLRLGYRPTQQRSTISAADRRLFADDCSQSTQPVTGATLCHRRHEYSWRLWSLLRTPLIPVHPPRGVARNLFRSGTKEGVPSSAAEPQMGSGAKSPGQQKPENILNIRLSVTYSVLFREKNFHCGNFGGDMSPLPPPLLYAATSAA